MTVYVIASTSEGVIPVRRERRGRTEPRTLRPFDIYRWEEDGSHCISLPRVVGHRSSRLGTSSYDIRFSTRSGDPLDRGLVSHNLFQKQRKNLRGD